MRVAVTLDPMLDALRAATPAETAERIESLATEALLTRSRTTETAVVAAPGAPGGRAVRKRWSWPRAADRARGTFRTTLGAPSPARREHDALLRLRALPSGPFAPRPFAIVERRAAGVLRSCCLLLEEIPGATDLATFLRDERDASRRRAVLLDLARRTRDMHAAGLLDREHHPRNVLVAAGRTWKVDCAKQRVRGASVPAADALDDLACLDVGLVRLATVDERRAFLGAALGAEPGPAVLSDLERRRGRIDARESRRLPPTRLPIDNDR